jgi:TolB protein
MGRQKGKVKSYRCFYAETYNIIILILFLIISIGCEHAPTHRNDDKEPAWSPDGRYIAFYRDPNRNPPVPFGEEDSSGIWILDLETMEANFLTDGSSPDWSPDGKWIAYVYNRNIYKINLETKEIKQLTTWGSCFFPDWAPNGKRIAFDTNHDDPKGANVIWLMDSSGTNYKDISIHGTGEWREPNWSSSGDRLVHIRYVAGGDPFREIFIMDSTGENSVRLTNNQIDDFSPAWSPDGSKIAYSSYTSEKINIYVIDTLGQNNIQLTNVVMAIDPSWSPDGSKIVFSQRDEESATMSLWIMNSDGSEKRRITWPDD